jgi:hypothetical protein
VNVRRHLDVFTRARIGELRLTTEQLTVRMELTEEEMPARPKDARGLEEHDRQVVNMLEDQVSHDDVE